MTASIVSNFAILDVKDGREQLAARIAAGERVLLTAVLEVDEASHDDGVSREFNCVVRSISEGGQ